KPRAAPCWGISTLQYPANCVLEYALNEPGGSGAPRLLLSSSMLNGPATTTRSGTGRAPTLLTRHTTCCDSSPTSGGVARVTPASAVRPTTSASVQTSSDRDIRTSFRGLRFAGTPQNPSRARPTDRRASTGPGRGELAHRGGRGPGRPEAALGQQAERDHARRRHHGPGRVARDDRPPP